MNPQSRDPLCFRHWPLLPCNKDNLRSHLSHIAEPRHVLLSGPDCVCSKSVWEACRAPNCQEVHGFPPWLPWLRLHCNQSGRWGASEGGGNQLTSSPARPDPQGQCPQCPFCTTVDFLGVGFAQPLPRDLWVGGAWLTYFPPVWAIQLAALVRHWLSTQTMCNTQTM